MAAEGNKKAKLAYKLAENYDELISSTLVGNNVVNIAATTIRSEEHTSELQSPC